MQSLDLETQARELIDAYAEARRAIAQAAEHLPGGTTGWFGAYVIPEVSRNVALIDVLIEAFRRAFPQVLGSLDEQTTALTALADSRRRIMEADTPMRVACLYLLIERILVGLANLSGRNSTSLSDRLPNGEPESELLMSLLSQPLPLDEAGLCRVLRTIAANDISWRNWGMLPVDRLLGHVTSHVRRHGMSPDLARVLEDLRASAARTMPSAQAIGTIDALFGIPLDPVDAWGGAARGWFLELNEPERTHWRALLEHAKTATSARPSRAFLDQARRHIGAVGEAEARRSILRLLALLVDLAPRTEPAQQYGYRRSAAFVPLTERNATLVRGLVWYSAAFGDAETSATLARICAASLIEAPGQSVKTANACVWALGAMPGMHGVVQLHRLAQRLKHRGLQRLIGESLTAAAARAGLSRAEFDELLVPDHGLVDGRIRSEIGGCVAEIVAHGVHRVEVRWFNREGALLRTAPAAVRRECKADLKALKLTVDEMSASLLAQRDRVDALYLVERSWPLRLWRERYLDHPLVPVVARQLIWWFGEGADARSGACLDGRIVDTEDRPLDDLDDETPVRLWHPIGVAPEDVLARRAWLERHGVTQPFKQAHREVYLLTDAERATRVYSNRFAAHIIRQHQFNSLCAVRGWRNKLRLMVDDVYPPASKDIPAHDLRAEFWVEGVGGQYGVDTNETGTYLRLATDQVRFYRIGDPQRLAHAGGGGYFPAHRRGAAPDEPVPLEEIPPLVFSEVMRDVDLFIGVASVGNDPTWQDGGPDGRFRDYWYGYAFGDLSATAQTRRAVLERLLPRLKIADRCTMTDRFLVVRGDLRTYKIHLGSGNILMEPNDQYLCIVPDRRKSTDGPAGVMLPFEGDSVLSLVLSKAFLLADDRAITDPTITRQIGARP